MQYSPDKVSSFKFDWRFVSGSLNFLAAFSDGQELNRIGFCIQSLDRLFYKLIDDPQWKFPAASGAYRVFLPSFFFLSLSCYGVFSSASAELFTVRSLRKESGPVAAFCLMRRHRSIAGSIHSMSHSCRHHHGPVARTDFSSRPLKRP